MPIKYSFTYIVTSDECIAGIGQIPERGAASEYIKPWYKGSVCLRQLKQYLSGQMKKKKYV